MDSFDDIVSGLFETTFDDVENEDQTDLYAVRMVFSDSETENSHALIIPWVGYDPKMAMKIRDKFTKDQRGMTMITVWYNISYLHGDVPNRWIPTAARVVKLAVAPF